MRLLFGSHLIDVDISPQERTTLAERQASVHHPPAPPATVAIPVDELTSADGGHRLPAGVVPVLASPVKPLPAGELPNVIPSSTDGMNVADKDQKSGVIPTTASVSPSSSPLQTRSRDIVGSTKKSSSSSMPVPIATRGQPTPAHPTMAWSSGSRSSQGTPAQSSFSPDVKFSVTVTPKTAELFTLIASKEKNEDKSTVMTQVCTAELALKHPPSLSAV